MSLVLIDKLGVAITMPRYYLSQVLRHLQSEAAISQPTLEYKVQQIGAIPTLMVYKLKCVYSEIYVP